MTPTLRGSTAPLPGTPAGQQTDRATSPSNTAIGDLVLVVTWHGHSTPTSSVLTIRSGYNQLVNYFHDDLSSDGSLGIAWIIATQAGAQVYQAFDSSSQSTDCRTALRVYQVNTFDASSFPFAAAASLTDGSVAPDPGNVTGLDSTRDYLVEAIGCWWHPAGTVQCVPGAPSGYSNLIETQSAGWLDLAVANKAVSGATSENPGVFTDNVDSTTNRGSVSCAVAIFGSARRAQVGYAALEVPSDTGRHAQLGFAQFEVPAGNTRAAVIGQAELLVPDYNFPSQILILFNKSWARYRYEANQPSASTPRRAQLGHAVLEVPPSERRSVIGYAQLETPVANEGVVAVGACLGTGRAPSTVDPAYTAWLGRTIDCHVEGFFPWGTVGTNGNWTFITSPNTVPGTLGSWGTWMAARPSRRLELMMGMMPWSGSAGSNSGFYLAEIAAGTHDSKFTSCATALKNTYGLGGSDSQPVYIRLAWEMELNFAWGVGTNSTKMANFGPAWRRVVDLMRAVSPHFKFAFCPGQYVYRLSTWGTPWLNVVYPGNDHVDLIGGDFYDLTGGFYPPQTLAQQTSCWNTYLVLNLQAMDDFAESKGKPQMFGEWGVAHSLEASDHGGDDNPLFIENTYNWVTTHNFEYVNYFNDNNSQLHHRLETGEFPNAAAKYIELFGAAPHPW